MAYIDTKYLGQCETCRHHRSGKCDTWCECGECYQPDMSKIPNADVEEVKHGYWEEIKCGDGIFDYCFRCSNCGKTTPPKAFPVAPDYCPNCPAKMDGGKAE